MTKDEALKLGIESLEWHNQHMHRKISEQAIAAMKEALAQPEQEPVAFVKGCNRGQWEIFPAKAYQIFEREQPLYTTPPQRKPLTENEIKHLWYEACQTNLELTSQLIVHLARNIEAAHGIKGEA